MNKKRKILYLRNQIMIDNERITLLLDIIASNRIETINESIILANIALNRSMQIRKNNQKIGEILGI